MLNDHSFVACTLLTLIVGLYVVVQFFTHFSIPAKLNISNKDMYFYRIRKTYITV